MSTRPIQRRDIASLRASKCTLYPLAKHDLVGQLQLISTEIPLEAELSKSIRTEYNKLLEEIEKVPARAQSTKNIQGTGGKVSVRDLIAYQIGWGTLLLNWYNVGLKGKTPEMPGNGFADMGLCWLGTPFL